MLRIIAKTKTFYIFQNSMQFRRVVMYLYGMRSVNVDDGRGLYDNY